MSEIDVIRKVIDWTNSNEGFLALLIFAITLLVGWLSGIFRALRKKPKLRIDLIEGPNFVCTFETGRQHNGVATHYTGIALYLSIKNIGFSDTEIVTIYVGYHNRFRYQACRRFWIFGPTTALGDFRTAIGEHLKVYPFLIQRNFLIPNAGGNTFVKQGGRGVGVVYWEQPESCGGYFPAVDRRGMVHLKLRVLDTYRRSYGGSARVPMVSLERARNFLPEFGMTREALFKGRPPGPPELVDNPTV